MTEVAGIDGLKAALKFGIEIGEAVEKASADGKLDITDAPLFFAPFMSAAGSFSSFGQIPKEAKDLSVDEMGQLVAYAQTELELTHHNIEVIIEKALGLSVVVYQLVEAFRKKPAAPVAAPVA